MFYNWTWINGSILQPTTNLRMVNFMHKGHTPS